MTIRAALPKAQKTYYQHNVGDQVIVDEYHWLRDYNWPNVTKPEVLDYLQQENHYFKEFTDNNKSLVDELYQELKSRIKEEDESFPVKLDNYYYYVRTITGENHFIFCRKEGTLSNSEHIILDANQLAKGHKAFSLGDTSISPDHKLLAYSVDQDGAERYKIKIKNLETDQDLTDEITDSFGGIIWHENNKGFYYTPVDQSWRTNKVYFHHIGTDQTEDKLIFSESDFTFTVSIDKSASKKFLIIDIASQNENEIWLIDLMGESNEPYLFIKRQEQRLYSLDHRPGEFYILTNDNGKNFRLVRTSENKISAEYWIEVIAHNKEVYLIDFLLFKAGLVVEQRINGLTQVLIKNYDFTTSKKLDVTKEETYDLHTEFTEYDTQFLRLSYSSLATPASTLEYSFAEDKLYTRKIQEIPGNFVSSNYQTERIYVKSHDQVEVPVSIVYRKNLRENNKPNPCVLYGYGAYGMAIPPSFRSNIVSLLDRGYIFAIAHIRGGDDLGYEWYESGKFLTKKNTFFDFIAVGEHLVEHNYTNKDLLAIMGRSAGGMLVGAVANERADLFKAIVCSVPFVDVLNTMLDDSLPLTPGEFKEWGNPKDQEYFVYMKSYSPYDNIKKQNYPHIMVTAGLTDPRVTYWEPAKWVAKLRELKTDDNLILFKTEMDAGHKGETGRYDALKEVAEEYAFLLKVL